MTIRSWAAAAVAAASLAAAPAQAGPPEAPESREAVTATAEPAAGAPTRIFGTERYRTSLAASQYAYPAGADVVFVADGRTFPDALAAGPAAGLLGGPVLLARGGAGSIEDEIARLSPRRVYVLGGEAVFDEDVVEAAGRHRLAGPDRYATAAAVAGLWESADTVYVAAGASFPDAMAGGAAAAAQGAPVLLSRERAMSPETVSRLESLDPARVVVLGGTSALRPSVVTQIRETVPGVAVTRHAGKNRYETAARVAASAWPDGTDTAVYASGQHFPDALSGVPVAAVRNAPMLLLREDCTPVPTHDLVRSWDLTTELLLGGPAAVASGALDGVCGAPTGGAVTALNALDVRDRASRDGYDRSRFGPAWTDDVDVQGGRNGCDTRNDVLRRDLVALTLADDGKGCTVLTGTLRDPYSGDTIEFRRGVGTSNAVQIDHLVALSNAWQTGAQRLDVETRTQLANDPLNLWAVDGPLNGSKGDKDASEWLPPDEAAHCDLVSHQVAVKGTYQLWVTAAEKSAIRDVLQTCPSQPLPSREVWAVPQPRP